MYEKTYIYNNVSGPRVHGDLASLRGPCNAPATLPDAATDASWPLLLPGPVI